MRTTLEIDPRVLAAARARVYEGRNRSLGEAVSQLALAGLASEVPQQSRASGLVLLPSVPGHVITDEMVAEALLDE
ncbi:MAG: hypothetical protein LBU50_05025 [Cellulomonas sp.]|jgi:hypothetical protein|nr:hypothetical protein [Cellulomonas sp.]